MPNGTCSLPECDRKAYCRQMCKAHYSAEMGFEQRRKKPATCGECGTDYMRSRGSSGNCPPCAKRIASAKQAESRRINWPKCAVFFPECAHCGKRFSSRKPGWRYCSEFCRKETEAARSGRRFRSCRDCSAPLGQFSLVSLCDPCREMALKASRKRRRKKEWAAGMRKSDRSRARQAGVEYEPIARLKVYERDGWTCGICTQPVDKALCYPDPRSASLDHVIPLAHGGGHTWGNVQCAHLECNVQKGAQTESSAA